ncbi:ABC transporter substrate-binding protein [Phytoactinopolyspora mesophila]|uniref:ABC transporter substrate-binding protein n=1 Tax=Phytoactinopolyspora mesophila TaxID=2650750 RepID=A0A7K3M2A5_9ACTN|nr:ABC transporter substrate-binding protein [Phytoactinopolyspora mesophila]NDL57416.1 ABC transporter substrate-binding protein [Phytoactinopolyspora mesophila]
MRIVSLLPSATEILFALGAGDDVVGVTFECDHPPQARTKRIVSTSALPEGLPPAGIDRVVNERMAAGEDLYHLDRAALAGLDVDLVLTQDLCAVCAVDVSTVHDALEYLACRADVLTVDPQTLTEVLQSVVVIGDAVGRRETADRLTTSLSERLDVVRDQVRAQAPVRALVLEWTDPPFAPGHWVPDMVAAAGGLCVLGESGARSYRTTWEDVAAAEADVVVSAPCGYGLETSGELAHDVVARELLPPGVPLWAVDANASFARPGPRLVDGVEALAGIFHPEVANAPDPALAVQIR